MYPLDPTYIALEAMAIEIDEIVSREPSHFYGMVIFQNYVNVYQRVSMVKSRMNLM